MSKKADRLLERARRAPAGWMPRDLERLYKAFGFEIRNSRGSHRNVSHPDSTLLRAGYVEHPKELGKKYVTDAVRLIDQLLEFQKEQDENV